MKRTTLLILMLAVIFSVRTEAQSRRSSRGSAKAQTREVWLPPELKVDLEFVDQNGVLEAFEQSCIRVTVRNEGGMTDNVTISANPQKLYPGLVLPQRTFQKKIQKGESVIVDIPLTAGSNAVTCADVRIDIRVAEPSGYDMSAVIEFPMLEYQPPKLALSDIAIVDIGEGLRPLNGRPDGILQRGEVVNATVTIRNIGSGTAENVRYTLNSGDLNVFLLTESGMTKSLTGSLENVHSGQERQFTFRMSVNNNYVHRNEYVPVYLTVLTEKGRGNMNIQLPIPLDSEPVAPETVSVEADLDAMIAALGKGRVIVEEDMRETPVKDISSAPLGMPVSEDAIAIVIGTEKYSDRNIPMAPYAARDAKVMADYFSRTMGVQQVRLITDSQATLMELNTLFDSSKGRLPRTVKKGATDVFVYYSGHGVPIVTDDGMNDILLIPYDVEKAWIKEYGFSLNKLYADLDALGARSVTVMLDACFSGGSRPSGLFRSESVANQKLVVADDMAMAQPWLDNPSFRVMTSSRGDQTSLGFDPSRSGLFTYHLATGMQGDADTDGDKAITIGELSDYVSEKVSHDSDGAQTPQLYGDRNLVLVRFE